MGFAQLNRNTIQYIYFGKHERCTIANADFLSKYRNNTEFSLNIKECTAFLSFRQILISGDFFCMESEGRNLQTPEFKCLENEVLHWSGNSAMLNWGGGLCRNIEN
jgi:hypothetical protein